MSIQTQQPRPSPIRRPTQSAPQPKTVGNVALARRLSLARLPRVQSSINWARRTLRGQFTTLATIVLIIAIALGLIAQNAFRQAREDLDTVASRSAPIIDAAQAMGQYIQEIDVKSADFLTTSSLKKSAPCALPVTKYNPGTITVHNCDSMAISDNIALFNQALYNATHSATFPGEQTAVARITSGFEEYVSDIRLMFHEYNLASDNTNLQDEHIQRAHKAYISASNVLLLHISPASVLDEHGLQTYREQNVPSCTVDDPLGQRELPDWQWPNGSLETNINCLSALNKAHLDTAYENMQFTQTVLLILLILFSCALVALLVVSTIRMMVVTHRVINPGLTLALLLTIVASIPLLITYANLGGRHGTFGQLVRDDYDSIYYAANLNRYAGAAKADELRWLIALQDADQSQVTRWADDWQDNEHRVELLITRTKNNRTWPEEDQSLVDMLNNWHTYQANDSEVRAKAMETNNPQRFTQAEQLSTGNATQTFTSFTAAVDRLDEVNRRYFDRTASEAANSTASSALWSIVLFPVVGLLAVWGIWRRVGDF
jgi:hypothetical protein